MLGSFPKICKKIHVFSILRKNISTRAKEKLKTNSKELQRGLENYYFNEPIKSSDTALEKKLNEFRGSLNSTEYKLLECKENSYDYNLNRYKLGGKCFQSNFT